MATALDSSAETNSFFNLIKASRKPRSLASLSWSEACSRRTSCRPDLSSTRRNRRSSAACSCAASATRSDFCKSISRINSAHRSSARSETARAAAICRSRSPLRWRCSRSSDATCSSLRLRMPPPSSCPPALASARAIVAAAPRSWSMASSCSRYTFSVSLSISALSATASRRNASRPSSRRDSAKAKARFFSATSAFSDAIVCVAIACSRDWSFLSKASRCAGRVRGDRVAPPATPRCFKNALAAANPGTASCADSPDVRS
mmetsp:Transcript_28892/g.97419  ORF Transcript_28892/g.97419 Transcript_28892/m.97419 type:complete len:262 (-) Transcript_28892:1875-2660(-)